jgi:hypothetical protein
MSRRVVEAVEQLDGMLKRREPADAIKPLLASLAQQLQDVVGLLGTLADAR